MALALTRGKLPEPTRLHRPSDLRYSYWDFPYNNFNYSYVDVATDQYKYCTLAIDRLGIGKSTHGEVLNEIQAPLEVAALAEITRMLRNGSIPQIPRAFRRVTHVG